MSCSFYAFRCNDYYCMKKGDYISSDVYYRYCKGYSYDECPIYKGEDSSSGCYLTTACVVAMDKGDNCEELNILREFRDEYMNRDSCMKYDIHEYYKYAPEIVKKINLLDNYKQIYKELYFELICPCIAYIKNGQVKEAYSLYKSMYNKLKTTYLK